MQTALNRFLSKAAERVIPCLDTLKKCINKKDFCWTEIAEEAFQAMKKLIAELPTLTAPIKDEELMVYLSAASEAVSAVLLVERSRRQMPIYYVSRSLDGTELNYAMMEKLSLALVHAARRLRRYFQGHIIKVITDKPINQILNGPEASGRLAKWIVALGAYDITYALRNVIKGQVLADFLADTIQSRTDLDRSLRSKDRMKPGGKDKEIQRESARDSQANCVIREIHIGSCRMHDGQRRVVHKAMNAWYYWPSIHRDANNKIKSCDACQAYATVPRLPKDDMISVTSAWPFRKWIIDIVGPLPEALGKLKYLIVAVDYFTKWLKAKPVASITGRQVKSFAFDNIVCRFGVLAIIITDNGTHLINEPFKSWAEGLEIKLISTSVYHPQANRAVERANRSIMQGIKTRLHQEGAGWVEKLPNVLWAYRIMPKISNEETLFSLAYGTEAVIPAEIGMPTRRTTQGTDEENDVELRLNLNLLEE
ncbi:reverse transcriptase domain-containing protein [Tanacetum coccineum]